MSEKHPEMLVGAGTVLTIEQVDEAVAAGAKFIVSPGLNPEIVKYCLEKNIAVTPGVVTSSEMAQAVELGLPLVKFFPAEPSGGLPMIHAVAAAYTTLKFMPTGGINPGNVRDYLKDDKIFACGGSWMCPGHMIEQGRFDEITDLCRKAVKTVHQFQILRLILPAEDTPPIPTCLEDALEAGSQKKVVLGVNHVARALTVLERLGYVRIPGEPETVVSDHGGQLILELIAL